MTRRSEKLAERAEAFQDELNALVRRHLGIAPNDAEHQTNILAVLVAEGIRGQCESGVPAETAARAVLLVYAQHQALASK